jgi:hypothetical protein
MYENSAQDPQLILPLIIPLNMENTSENQSFLHSPTSGKHRLNGKDVTKHSPQNKKKLNILYSKIFNQELETILKIKEYKDIFKKDSKNKRSQLNNSEEERKNFRKKSPINTEIVGLKEKVHFMKGVIDYVFPKIMIDKVKISHENSLDHHNIIKKNGKKYDRSKILQYEPYYSKVLETSNISNENINLPFYFPENHIDSYLTNLKKLENTGRKLPGIKSLQYLSKTPSNNYPKKSKFKIFSPFYLKSVQSLEEF